MNILIIGLGSIAGKHIHVLKELIGSDLSFFALRSDVNQTEMPGVKNIYSIDELNEKIDFAIISNPTYSHFETINMMIEYSIPLFIEKPIVSKIEDAEILLKPLNDSNIFTYVGCNLRFHPCIKYLKNYLSFERVKTINEVNVYSGSYLPDWRPGKDYRTIYSASKDLGGGVHLDLFHEFDYIVWLLGQPDQVRSTRKSCSTLKIDAVDYANYCLGYPGFSVSIILNYYRRKSKRTIEIVFENETWTVDLINNTIKDDQNSIIFEAEDFVMMNSYYDQMKYFIDHLTKKQTPMNTFAESAQILKICFDNE
ncbi:Predicted dehydrogenase [Daejeonella rubra]|uniref:Predicted dehydrogenase n=1 Tax=Daejeonella rubra TaxID=990371 RepID=A0A1G9WUW5_9SPHI|nr:Gfo/Idh/MocA family oxidoreductase [Daejeonella rubra]SDM87925.1 Predicted dehydrogenase [Daejeonella rubra]